MSLGDIAAYALNTFRPDLFLLLAIFPNLLQLRVIGHFFIGGHMLGRAEDSVKFFDGDVPFFGLQ